MDIISLLNETKEATLPYYDLSSGKLSKSYAPAKWSVKKLLVHLSDAEAIFSDRIKRVIAEPKQVIWAFDQDRFCNNLQYDTFPLHLSKALYLANRESVIFLASTFYHSVGSNQFVHSDTGLRTLKDEIDKVVMHNQNHLRQIEIALSS